MQGIFRKCDAPTIVLYQCAMASLLDSHGSYTHICTDDIAFSCGSTTSFVFPAGGTIMGYTPSHRASSIVAERTALQKALEIIDKNPPTSSMTFSDSKVASQDLLSVSRRGIYFCLVYDIFVLFRGFLKSGHTVCILWIPVTAALPTATQEIKPRNMSITITLSHQFFTYDRISGTL